VPANVVGSIGDGNTFGGAIHVFHDITKTATWPKIDGDYVVEGLVRVSSSSSSVTLTLPEGATVRMNGDARWEFGGGGGGGLIAKNVTFTSSSKTPAAGDWAGMVFFDKTGLTTIDGCTFAYAGQSTYASVGVLDFHGGKPADRPGFKMTHTSFKSVKGPVVHADKGDCGDLFAAASGNEVGTATACSKDAK
jgi:hypothetical protein